MEEDEQKREVLADTKTSRELPPNKQDERSPLPLLKHSASQESNAAGGISDKPLALQVAPSDDKTHLRIILSDAKDYSWISGAALRWMNNRKW